MIIFATVIIATIPLLLLLLMMMMMLLIAVVITGTPAARGSKRDAFHFLSSLSILPVALGYSRRSVIAKPAIDCRRHAHTSSASHLSLARGGGETPAARLGRLLLMLPDIRG